MGKRSSGRTKSTGKIAVSALTAAAIATAGLGSAPTAHATCASFFGIGNSANCTSTPVSIAIAIGTDAQAKATGLFGAAFAVGTNSAALTGDAFTFGVAAGDFAYAAGAGVFGIAVAPWFGRLVRFFPPIVTGTIIAIIGITLLRVGINWAGGGVGNKNFGAPEYLVTVLIVLAVILALNKYGRGFLPNIAVLIGLAVGFAWAWGNGMVRFDGVAESEWFAVVYPFRFGTPTFEPAAIVSLCIVMVVVMVESTGMFLALGEICGKKVGASELGRGLATDGLGTVIGGVFNTFPYTSFSQNVGLVGITGVRSRYVVAVSGVILLAFGLFPKMGAVVASIPQPVLGGAGLCMFGMVAATGIKILARVDYTPRHNLIIVAVSIAVGMIPLVSPNFFAQAPKWLDAITHSGITLTAVCVILLNAFYNGGGSDERAVDDLVAVAKTQGTTD